MRNWSWYSHIKIITKRIGRKLEWRKLLKYFHSFSYQRNSLFSNVQVWKKTSTFLYPAVFRLTLPSSGLNSECIYSVYFLTFTHDIQSALPVITTMVLWTLMHLGTLCTLMYTDVHIYIIYTFISIIYYIYIYIYIIDINVYIIFNIDR